MRSGAGGISRPAWVAARAAWAALALHLAALACFSSGTEPAAAPPPQPRPAESVVRGPLLLLRGATVMSAAGPTLARGDVLLSGAEIRAVGENLSAPQGATVVDLAGRWITPGLIDPHSHIGVFPVPEVAGNADGNEATGPLQPDLDAADSFWPQDPSIGPAIAGGVTTIHVLPGSANLIGGRGFTVYLRPPFELEAMRVPNAPRSMKMACGENPKRTYGSRTQAPSTRMAEVALLRQQLERARAYAPAPGAERDFGKAALRSALEGETLIQNHCYRADEMVARLELFSEFGVKPRAFHHAVEAYKIRDALAKADVGAVVWADRWGIKFEMLDAVPANAALLDEAGVRVALHSDSPDDIQRLNQMAALALAAGLRAGIPVDRDRAIRWITANPAWVLGIEAKHGTLEPGKLANLTVWSGDPFSVYTRAERVYIEGKLIYDRADPSLLPSSDFELGVRSRP
jgi:imidazolonepropionase-like amidohydrolase